MKVTKSSIQLFASAKAVIANFLYLPGINRVSDVINRVKNLSDDEVELCLEKIWADFSNRHRDFENILLAHFDRINNQYESNLLSFSPNKKLLLGAFFTKEYSIQAAALFNPSIVPHPDQSGINQGEQRFIMSLRATGEGHISSIVFRTGVINDLSEITLDKEPGYHTCLKKNQNAQYTKQFVQQRMASLNGGNEEFFKHFPEEFTAAQAIQIINDKQLYQQESMAGLCKQVNEILDSNYELESSSNLPLNEKVIFPNSKSECMGMEDVRFVKFEDSGNTFYYGTYTAYNGRAINTHLIETKDFDVFKIRTLYGNAISDKGMALFPEKVDGKYVMIARQGGEKISIMYSDNLYHWENSYILMEPEYLWEFVQLGNCGSPVKTEQGWLLLTHGVGAMRTYVISAILLDLADPSKIIGRLDKPLITANETEREGYVPNVVYTCGLMRHGNMLVIPYAVSDSATGFVTISVNELLDELKRNN